jgi:ASCH domain
VPIRQPWAALVAAGFKTLEIRSWVTHYRGPVLVHAAKLPDRRPEAWDRLTTPDVDRLSSVTGGILAEVRLIDCRTYNSPEGFAADTARHLNDPAWFPPSGAFGFEFADARLVPFFAVNGQTKFFTVKGFPPS